MICWITIICRATNEQPTETFIFPTTFLRQESIRAFDILSNNAVSSKSVVELSRAAESFSLEYFQVNNFLFVHTQLVNYFYYSFAFVFW